MEKINFEDLPSTNTPINSENLNKLQSNIENAINNTTTTSGNFLKFDNGILINWGQIVVEANVDNKTVTFAEPFINSLYFVSFGNGFRSAINRIWAWSDKQPTSFGLWVRTPENTVSTGATVVDYFAIGKWK